MTFRPELAAAVMAGTKTITRRPANDRPRSPWWQGRTSWPDTVAVQPGRGKPAIGRARVLSACLEPLGFLTDDEARREGFADHVQFEDTWQALHGGDYRPEALVWRVELEAIR